VQAVSNDPTELIINSTWRATRRSRRGGVACARSAGNVLLPELAVKLSLRLPPDV